MDSGCSLGCFNCCFFNCLNSITLSIFEFILSSIGIGFNSAILSLTKKVMGFSKFMVSIQVINISFFSTGTGMSTILAIFKFLEKLEYGCFYKFGVFSSKLYSYLSKILMLLNIIGFFYLISFTHFLTIKVSAEKLFNETLIHHLGPGKEIEYEVKYVNKTFHCEKYPCSDELLNEDEEEEEKENFGEVFQVLFYSILSCILMFFNGGLFLSDSKRIEFLCSGKLQLELRPIEAVTCLCNRKKSLNLLNLLFCYKATTLNIEKLIILFCILMVFVSISMIILWAVTPWPQAYFFHPFPVFGPLVMAGICFYLVLFWITFCKNSKDKGLSYKKCLAVIGIIIAIIYFPFCIVGVPLLVGSQNGNIYYKAYCYSVSNVDYKEFYKSVCNGDGFNVYLFIKLKSCSSGIIIGVFCIGLIEVILNFYLIILLMNYSQRVGPEFGLENRIYDAITYIVDKNGEKICIDDIEIECENNKYKRKLVEKENQEIQEIPIVETIQISSNRNNANT